LPGPKDCQSTIPPWESGLSWAQVSLHSFFVAFAALCSFPLFSLAMIELRIILAKIIWTYDFRLTDDNLDWDAANKSYVFWDKPQLPVQFQRRLAV
jgi:hypothetical protein